MRMRCEQFLLVLKLGCGKRSVLGDGCARCEACLRCLHEGQNPKRPGTGPSSSCCCCWRWPPSHQAFSSVFSPLLAASQRTIGCFRRRSPLTLPPSLLFLRMMSPHRQNQRRCRTITVDLSTNVQVCCKCQPSSDQQQQQQGGGGEAKVHPSEAADEAAAIRLYTSCSEGVSVEFAGLLSPAGDTSDSGAAATAVTYHVPKDWRYEKGDGPRSVTRITVDRSGSGAGGGGECKTLRCDQYGIPLEEVEAGKAGVPWTWEHGRADAEVLPEAAAQPEES